MSLRVPSLSGAESGSTARLATLGHVEAPEYCDGNPLR